MTTPGRTALDLADLLDRSYRRVVDALTGLDDLGYYEPTRCRGMAVGDLLVHLRMDAERALVALATPSAGEPDRDHATYWHDFRPGQPDRSADQVEPTSLGSVRFVRGVTTAYHRPSQGLRRHFADVTAAAARAAVTAAGPAAGTAAGDQGPDGLATRRVRTQGHVLALPDFLATLVLEACIHTLDLQPSLPVEPEPDAVAVTARTLDTLAGADLRSIAGWDDATYLLKATGRTGLDDTDRAALGLAASRLPLLG